MDLRRIFSNQIRSSSSEAVFWPMDRFVRVIKRCMIIGKYI